MLNLITKYTKKRDGADFICNLCWHNSTSFLNSMINIFISKTWNLGLLLLFCRPTYPKSFPWLSVEQKFKLPLPNIPISNCHLSCIDKCQLRRIKWNEAFNEGFQSGLVVHLLFSLYYYYKNFLSPVKVTS